MIFFDFQVMYVFGHVSDICHFKQHIYHVTKAKYLTTKQTLTTTSMTFINY